jgi:hypothetical protein
MQAIAPRPILPQGLEVEGAADHPPETAPAVAILPVPPFRPMSRRPSRSPSEVLPPPKSFSRAFLFSTCSTRATCRHPHPPTPSIRVPTTLPRVQRPTEVSLQRFQCSSAADQRHSKQAGQVALPLRLSPIFAHHRSDKSHPKPVPRPNVRKVRSPATRTIAGPCGHRRGHGMRPAGYPRPRPAAISAATEFAAPERGLPQCKSAPRYGPDQPFSRAAPCCAGSRRGACVPSRAKPFQLNPVPVPQ